MKIAIVTETFLPSTDGIVTRLCASVKWLLDEGHEVLLVAPDQGVYEYKGARVEGIPARSFFFYRSKQFALPRRKVRGILEEFQPDLIHVVNPAILGVAGIYYGRRLRFPMVASYHTNVAQYLDYYHFSLFKPLIWWYFRLLHNKADLNLCTSRAVQDELQERNFKNVELWKRGVAIDQFHPNRYSDTMREKLTNGNKDHLLMLYVGRLAAEKEIERVKDVLEQRSDVSLAIVGDGPHRPPLEEHFKGTRTVFTGFMHGDELAEAYASADVFVFPSTTETLGLVILEAMASGLPVIAAQSGPSCEQIQDQVNGWLYDPESKDSLIQSIDHLKDRQLRKQLGTQARSESERMGWSDASRQLYTFYRHVVENQKSEVP